MSILTISADTDLTDFRLDIFGQIPALRSYTNISSIYSVPDSISKTSIIDTLTTGLERLTASFPWVAGRVVVEDIAEGNTGVCKIKPFEKIPRFVVRDYRDNPSLSMNRLRDAQFPLAMLDESFVAPVSTMPAEDYFPDGRPVFMVQASFISGGLILTFVGEHRSMDITGQNKIIHLLSKACGNEPFSPEELSLGNMPRQNIMPLLDSHDSHILDHQPSNLPGEPTNPLSLPKSTWACFNFPSSSLAALKSLASDSLLTQYISTDDALSAFIWQSILRARLPRTQTAASSTLMRAIDLRPFLDIPPSYPGVLMTVTCTTSNLQHLATQQPLGHTASSLRENINPTKLAHMARAFATELHHAPDKSRVPFAPNMNPSTNVMFSSWSKIGLYGLDFYLGLGGPEAVRRPSLFPVEGLVYAMPRDSEGGIAVEVCLRYEDLVRLRGDEEFGKYATYIG